MTQRRNEVWILERNAAYTSDRGALPICNICGEPVADGADWHVSHDPAKPRCYGGKNVGVAHAACNLRHNAEVVTPNMAKADRVRAKHLGLKRPGMGRHPMRAGRRSRESKTMGKGGIVTRTTLAQKHAAMLAKRYGVRTEQGAAP